MNKNVQRVLYTAATRWKSAALHPLIGKALPRILSITHTIEAAHGVRSATSDIVILRNLPLSVCPMTCIELDERLDIAQLMSPGVV